MKLKLVKQGDFLGIKCDFYRDEQNNIYMSRTQVGYALQYKNPQHAILVIHQRHKERMDKFSVEVRGSQFETTSFNGLGKDKKAFMYIERGIYEICRRSKQKIADDFNDWVYETISQIRKNGFYIATEKDEKWLGAREDGKKERKAETDSIKEFVEYARQQGSNKPERYYIHFTKLVNSKLGIPKGMKREELTQRQLMDVACLERVISMKLPRLITDDMDYHEVYKKIKELISII